MGGAFNSESRSLVNELKNVFRRGIRRISESNYHWAKACYMRELDRSQRHFGETPVLVYQMGKVGSTSIVRSLKASNVDRPVYHPHFLSKERIAETEKDRKEFFRTERYSYLKRPWLYEFLVKQLEGGLKGGKWKVITLTRETVSRNISAFFENLEVERFEGRDRYRISSHYYKIPPTTIEINDLEPLSRLFFEKVNHDSPEQFFDREIRGVLGVDVFASEFPISKGYRIYQGELVDILLLRVEDLNRVAQEAFSEFLDIRKFELTNSNVGSEKGYAFLYKKFKKDVELPDEYLRRMYGSRYMRHFYSAREIERFQEKWRKAEKQEKGERIKV